MTAAIVLNALLGLAYSGYGVLSLLEIRSWGKHRIKATALHRHYAWAWVAMAFTCGPYHLIHAEHLWTDQTGEWIDAATVGFGLPFGIVWLTLTAAGQFGWRLPLGIAPTVNGVELLGDRHYTKGWPTTVLLLGSGLYLAALGFYFGATYTDLESFPPVVWANVALLVLYFAVSVVLWRTQVQRYRAEGYWSLLRRWFGDRVLDLWHVTPGRHGLARFDRPILEPLPLDRDRVHLDPRRHLLPVGRAGALHRSRTSLIPSNRKVKR